MQVLKSNSHWFLVILLTLGLIACGGGGSDDSAAAKTTLSGTVATGLAAANTIVTVVDSNGTVVTATTDASGNYSVKVTASAKPYMLKVEINGNLLFSFSESGGTANITPLTNLALFEANKDGLIYRDLNDLFTSFKINNSQVSSDDLKNAKALVRAQIASQLILNSVSNTFDFFTETFIADTSGLGGVSGIDDILDALTIIINGITSITINGSAFNSNLDFTNFLPIINNGSLTGTWNLLITGTVTSSVVTGAIGETKISGILSNDVPTISSAGQAEEALAASIGASLNGTQSNFSYTIVSSTATQVIADINSTITTDPIIFHGNTIYPIVIYTFDTRYTYTKQ